MTFVYVKKKEFTWIRDRKKNCLHFKCEFNVSNEFEKKKPWHELYIQTFISHMVKYESKKCDFLNFSCANFVFNIKCFDEKWNRSFKIELLEMLHLSIDRNIEEINCRHWLSCTFLAEVNKWLRSNWATAELYMLEPSNERWSLSKKTWSCLSVAPLFETTIGWAQETTQFHNLIGLLVRR